MKSAPIRYGTRFGCRFGQPHDAEILHETKSMKIERCRICGIRKRWNKSTGGRVDNPEYLKFHVRQFAQEGGSTRRVFAKMYRPDKCIIRL